MNPDFPYESEILVSQHSRRFSLHDSSLVYSIVKGSVDLFAVEKVNTQPEGKHFFLGEFETGSMLFPFSSSDKEQIIFLAEPGTQLKIHSLATLDQTIQEDPRETLAFLSIFQQWVAKLLRVFKKFQIPPQQAHYFSAKQPLIQLKAGEHLFAEHLVGEEENVVQWGILQKGCLAFQGWEDAKVSGFSILPLQKGILWKATEESVIQTAELFLLFLEKGWRPILEEVHAIILQAIICAKEEDVQRDRQLAHQKALLEERLISGSLEGLSAVLSEQEEKKIPHEDPLIGACRLIEAREKMSFEFPKESLANLSVFTKISEIARVSGLRFREVRLKSKWWREEGGSLIGFRDSNPVALLFSSRGVYQAIHPTTGHKLYLNASNAKDFFPRAFIFYPSFREESLDGKKVVKFGAKNEHAALWKLFFVSLGAAILNLFIPIATKLIVDIAIPELNKVILWQIGGALLAAVLSSGLFQLTRNLLVLRLSLVIGNRIEEAQWDHLLKLPAKFFKKSAVGELWNKVNAIPLMRRYVYSNVLSIALSALFSFFYLILMLFYSFSLTVMGLIVIGSILLFAFLSTLPQIRLSKSTFIQKGLLNGFAIQVIQGIEKLKVSGSEKRAFAHWAHLYADYKKQDLRLQHFGAATKTATSLLPTLSNFAIFSLVIYFVVSQGKLTSLTIGDFFGFMAAFGALTTALLSSIAPFTQLVGQVKSYWDQAKLIFQSKTEEDQKKSHPGRLQGSIKMDRIHFRYDPQGSTILNNVTIQAAPGEFIAIVGPSGCGKSTLIRLLLGFETPEKGTIYYDGNDIQHTDLRAIRKQLGVVLQDGAILAGTLYENLVCGGIYSKSQIEEAICLAGFEEDLKYFPMGLHTVVTSGGTTLSGGQKQRLLIARALIAKPKILLFDEATSALDNRTQEFISHNIESLSVTRIVIAHRLSTVRHADRIYVMQQGEVIDQGTFDELASRSGLFQTLLKRQKI